MIIPAIYRNIEDGPVGLPLRWIDEQTGVLACAIKAYLDNRFDGKPITETDLALVRAWFVYYIEAPCWRSHDQEDREYVDGFDALRRKAHQLRTPDDIEAWINECLDWGIDPL